MPRMTAIACDQCGRTETGIGYSGLMRRLRRAGWEKGPDPNTFFCDAPGCRAARLKAEAAAAVKRGKRHE